MATFSSLDKTGLKPPPLLDLLLITTTLTLVGFGIVMVYSTTGVISQDKFGDTFYFVRRQGLAAVLGLLAMLGVAHVPISVLRRAAPYCFLITVALLSLPLLPVIGDAAGGARRWVHLGTVRFQPGEICKLLFVIFMASYLKRHEHSLTGFMNGVLKPVLLFAPVGILLLLQPDFGSTAIIALVMLSMVASSGVRLRYLAYGVLALVGIAALLIIASPYRMSRMLSFMAPFSDPGGRGYQLIQSLIAIGSGEFFGVGLGASQQKLFFLPAAHTDFIFSVVSEELGFVGALILLGLFLVFLWRGFRLAAHLTDDTFCFSLTVGVTMLLVLPALLNVGVVTGLLPTKGLVLPFVGYGGSCMISSLISVGVLLSLARHFEQS